MWPVSTSSCADGGAGVVIATGTGTGCWNWSTVPKPVRSVGVVEMTPWGREAATGAGAEAGAGAGRGVACGETLILAAMGENSSGGSSGDSIRFSFATAGEFPEAFRQLPAARVGQYSWTVAPDFRVHFRGQMQRSECHCAPVGSAVAAKSS